MSFTGAVSYTGTWVYLGGMSFPRHRSFLRARSYSEVLTFFRTSLLGSLLGRHMNWVFSSADSKESCKTKRLVAGFFFGELDVKCFFLDFPLDDFLALGQASSPFQWPRCPQEVQGVTDLHGLSPVLLGFGIDGDRALEVESSTSTAFPFSSTHLLLELLVLEDSRIGLGERLITFRVIRVLSYEGIYQLIIRGCNPGFIIIARLLVIVILVVGVFSGLFIFHLIVLCCKGVLLATRFPSRLSEQQGTRGRWGMSSSWSTKVVLSLNYLTSCIWEVDPHRVADLAEVILIVDGAQDRNLLLWVKATKDQQHHRSEILWHLSSRAWLLKFAEVLLAPNNVGLHAFGRSPPNTWAIAGLRKQLVDFHWHFVSYC